MILSFTLNGIELGFTSAIVERAVRGDAKSIYCIAWTDERTRCCIDADPNKLNADRRDVARYARQQHAGHNGKRSAVQERRFAVQWQSSTSNVDPRSVLQ
jgi:hypothetical protein